MSDPAARPGDRPFGPGPSRQAAPAQPATLADLLERVLDKGVVIAGDIRVNLLDIELLTIRIRLLIASVDRAREMGIDWWEHDPTLSSSARKRELADGDRPEKGLPRRNRSDGDESDEDLAEGEES